MKKLAIAAIPLLLGGCTDYGECLDGHYQTYMQSQWTGKVMVTYPVTYWVCDRYEFPEGRPVDAPKK